MAASGAYFFFFLPFGVGGYILVGVFRAEVGDGKAVSFLGDCIAVSNFGIGIPVSFLGDGTVVSFISDGTVVSFFGDGTVVSFFGEGNDSFPAEISAVSGSFNLVGFFSYYLSASFGEGGG